MTHVTKIILFFPIFIFLTILIVGELESALKLPNNEFQSKYGRKKPHFDDEIILSCHFGKRSQIAAEIAIKNQFNNVKNYSGGWSDYSIKSKST